VKRSLVQISLISCCALMGAHAFAQSTSKTSVDAAKMQAAASIAKAAKPVVAVATLTAGGGVVVLADGIVADAAPAKTQPPADGFVYER
jgi:hypothetical protein